MLEPVVFARVTPITTVVVAEGTTYTAVVVTPTFAFVFNLKVFAMFYPSAIAIATASLSAVSATLTPLILTSTVLFIAP